MSGPHPDPLTDMLSGPHELGGRFESEAKAVTTCISDAELQTLLDAASPGPWHHVNPGMVSPKTRTIHGTVPAEPVDYVSTWPGLGTPSGHRVVINRNVGVRSDDMALIAEAPTLAAEVLTLRAGAAASAEHIKGLEARVAELEAEVEDLRATNEALALPEGSVLISSFDWSPPVAKEAEARALLKEPDQC